MFEDRIYILDGAMGTMVQRHGCCGGDFNSELLNFESPDLVKKIHRAYIDAGADIISTNSFCANAISQQAHGLASRAYDMAYAAAVLAREAADSASRKILVAGSAGPTGKSLSIPSDPSDAAFREIDFDTMSKAYCDQLRGLRDGGADLILLETCFDALNAKAAVYALRSIGCNLPVIVSATVSDRSGRTLGGQTLEAFYSSVEHTPNLAAFGINCALGASQMVPLVEDIASFSRHPLIFYPNAGLPDELGAYSDGPDEVASVISSLASRGLLNITGGCCGTTPEHISAIKAAVEGKSPRRTVERKEQLTVSGLESVLIDRSRNFTNVGERTNVAGSRKFARLIAERNFREALDIAAAQVEGGASIIDVNMDDPMLDSKECMVSFLRHIAGEPSVAKAAVMIDSSSWETVAAALKNVQGKAIVNSISLRDGEKVFVEKALEINALGAAMVVMAFDERGQAVSFERKIEICKRSYDILTKAGIAPSDIIFDANILAVGTGVAGHERYALDFIEAVRWIKTNLPGALTSGGVSNLSFAFRGNNPVREAMHSAFLCHAIQAGLDMAIVNPQMLRIYDDIEPGLLKAVEDVILCKDENASTRLLEYASKMSAADTGATPSAVRDEVPVDVEQRISDALVRGSFALMEAELEECCVKLGSAVAVVEGPLLKGMEKVGMFFSEGKMFLPQVVKSAGVMRSAVEYLQPKFGKENLSSSRPKVLLATVKGDVHDIGKNIVGAVLECSGFEVIDMGVMVPCEEIISKARETGADIIGVSGLISPSLSRMEEICKALSSSGSDIPLFVGGAAASLLHTSVKLAPLYENVHYGADASAAAVMAKKYISRKDEFLASERAEHSKVAELYRHSGRIAAESRPPVYVPEDFCHAGFENLDMTLAASELTDYIDWRMFYAVCGVKQADEALKAEALSEIGKYSVRLAARFLEARREGDDIVAVSAERFPMLRQEYSLADFYPYSGTSPLGLFAARVFSPAGEGLIKHAFGVALAEAASKYMNGIFSLAAGKDMKLIMPGIGYPCCPDHSLKRDVLALLPAELGISLTESAAMIPEESVCGFVIAHKDAAYRDIRRITAGQAEDYSARRRFTKSEEKLFLGHLI